MNYKLVAIDLDDTLLTSNSTIDDYTKQTIQKVVNAGVTVIIATGRMIRSARIFIKELGLTTPCITYAGALITNYDGTNLFSNAMDPKTTHALVQYCLDRDIHIQLYTNEDFIYAKENRFSAHYAKHQKFNGIEDRNYILNPNVESPKALIIDDPDKIVEIQKQMQQDFPNLRFFRSRPMYVDIVEPHTNKGTALEFLLNYYGIVKEEVIAIGDNEVDIEMLKLAGLGICVKNALPHVKEYANYITDTNDNLGVAKALEKFILEA